MRVLNKNLILSRYYSAGRSGNESANITRGTSQDALCVLHGCGFLGLDASLWGEGELAFWLALNPKP